MSNKSFKLFKIMTDLKGSQVCGDKTFNLNKGFIIEALDYNSAVNALIYELKKLINYNFNILSVSVIATQCEYTHDDLKEEIDTPYFKST
jgi:hypothetical protein